jgi:hypothetical protein
MADIDEIIEDLKQTRDEIRVKINLASKEVKDEWEELEEKMEDFSGKAKQFAEDAELKKTGTGIGDALGQLGSELKHGYDRIRDALRD